MFKSLKMFFAVVLMLSVVSMAQAAVYGYIVVTGKKADLVAREISTFEKLVQTWKNGEVLYVHNTVSGLVFKKYASVVVFSGEQSKISNFLTSGAYEGDYLKDIVVSLDYTSYGADGDEVESNNTLKFRNIRQAINVIKDKKDDSELWADYAKKSKKAYKAHLSSDGQLYDSKINVVFYSLQKAEENRIFGETLSPKGVKTFR